jgi:hypothetical protein
MMIGILFGLRGRTVSHVSVVVVLTGALVIGAGIFVNTQWIVPSAYQTLRTTIPVSPNRPKAPYELSFVSFLGCFGYGALTLFGEVFANVRAEPPYIDKEWTNQFINSVGSLPPFAAAWFANIVTVLAATAIATLVPGRLRISQ